LAQKMLPNATIVADRFHVIKMVGDELNSAIIKEKRAVNLIEDEAEKKEKQEILSQFLRRSF
jgi:transposase